MVTRLNRPTMLFVIGSVLMCLLVSMRSAPSVPATLAMPMAGGVGGISEYATPDSYTFTVPLRVDRILVELWGAGGGGGTPNIISSELTSEYNGYGGGSGGYVRAVIAVIPGETLTVTIGGGGEGGEFAGDPHGTVCESGGDTMIVRSTGELLAQSSGGRGAVNGSPPFGSAGAGGLPFLAYPDQYGTGILWPGSVGQQDYFLAQPGISAVASFDGRLPGRHMNPAQWFAGGGGGGSAFIGSFHDGWAGAAGYAIIQW